MASQPAEIDVTYDAEDATADFWIRAILFMIVVGTCFYFIDHTLLASTRYQFAEAFFVNDSSTADAIESLGAFSVPSRVLLGSLGFGLLLLPARGNANWRNPVLFCVTLMLAFTVASVLWSINPRFTLQKATSQVLFLVAAAGAARQFTLHQLAKLFPGICIGYILFGLLVELGLGTFTPWQSQYRFVGTTHPNTVAVYGSVCCICATAFASGRSTSKFWFCTLIAVGGVSLLLTKSRTTMAALVFAFAAMSYLRLQRSERVLIISSLMLVFCLITLSLTLIRPSTRTSLSRTFAMGRTENVGSLTGRLPLWEELGSHIQDKPIMGFGYSAFWDKRRIEDLTETLEWEVPNGHNMYIDVMIDGGAVGLVIFLCVFLVGLSCAVVRYKNYRDPAIAIAFSFLVFAIAHGTGESMFKTPTFMNFIVLTLAIRMGGLPPTPRKFLPVRKTAN